MFDFSNYSAKLNYYDKPNVLVVGKIGKIKDKMDEIGIKEFFGLKSKIYSILVSDSNECKKEKM